MAESSDTDDSVDIKIKESVIDIKDLAATASGARNSSSSNVQHGETASQKITKQSLRTEQQCEIEHELHTTPEFRSHVAKKLSELIDNSVELGSQWKHQKRLKNLSDEDTGINLFSTSTASTVSFTQEESSHRRNLKRSSRDSSSSSSSEDERISQAAVSAEFVFSTSALHPNPNQTETDTTTEMKELPHVDSCNDTSKSHTQDNCKKSKKTIKENVFEVKHNSDSVSKKLKKKKKKKRMESHQDL